MPAGWRYAVHEIGVDVDALDIRAADINDRGEIVGKLFCGERQANGVAVWRAFHWINGRTTLLSLLGGETSVAAAINNQGHIAGFSHTANNRKEPAYHAVLYRDGQSEDLGTLGGERSFASAISDAGHVAGTSHTGELGTNGRFAVHGFLWQAGSMTDLGRGYKPEGVNSQGWVVGSRKCADGRFKACLWANGRIEELGTLGGLRSFGDAINEAGEVAGRSGREDGSGHAFLWRPGCDMIDIGVFDGRESMAWGLNNRGDVVGSSSINWVSGTNYGLAAFLWRDGVLYDLNDLIDPASGWHLREASAISNAGRIIGYGTHGGRRHAFLLTHE